MLVPKDPSDLSKGAVVNDFSKICQHARAVGNGKQFALILLKTHMCDVGTGVCIRSLRSISDNRNTFIQDNFVTYDTRFFKYIYNKNANNIDQYELHDFRMNWIGEAFGKKDVDPELAVLYVGTTENPACEYFDRTKINTYDNSETKYNPFGWNDRSAALAIIHMIRCLITRGGEDTAFASQFPFLKINKEKVPMFKDKNYFENRRDNDYFKDASLWSDYNLSPKFRDVIRLSDNILANHYAQNTLGTFVPGKDNGSKGKVTFEDILYNEVLADPFDEYAFFPQCSGCCKEICEEAKKFPNEGVILYFIENEKFNKAWNNDLNRPQNEKMEDALKLFYVELLSKAEADTKNSLDPRKFYQYYYEFRNIHNK